MECWSKGDWSIGLRYVTPLLHHSITPTSTMLFDWLDRDHIGGAGLMKRQPGGDGDQVAALHEAELPAPSSGASRNIASVLLKCRDGDRVNTPNETKSFQSRPFRAERR